MVVPNDLDELLAAANVVTRQASENPGIGIPVDPEVADYMGAFTEHALVLEDLVDDALLTVNNQGEAVYE